MSKHSAQKARVRWSRLHPRHKFIVFIITYSCTGSWGDCVQLNKARFYAQLKKEAGLAHLSRSSLCGEQFLSCKHLGGG